MLIFAIIKVDVKKRNEASDVDENLVVCKVKLGNNVKSLKETWNNAF